MQLFWIGWQGPVSLGRWHFSPDLKEGREGAVRSLACTLQVPLWLKCWRLRQNLGDWGLHVDLQAFHPWPFQGKKYLKTVWRTQTWTGARLGVIHQESGALAKWVCPFKGWLLVSSHRLSLHGNVSSVSPELIPQENSEMQILISSLWAFICSLVIQLVFLNTMHNKTYRQHFPSTNTNIPTFTESPQGYGAEGF